MPRAPGEFVLQHYAGEVSYYGEGFLERNLDTLSGRLGELMASSAEPLLRALFREQRAELQPAATPRRRASTQGAQYPNPNPNPTPTPNPNPNPNRHPHPHPNQARSSSCSSARS